MTRKFWLWEYDDSTRRSELVLASESAFAGWRDGRAVQLVKKDELDALKAERDRLLAVLRIVRGKHGCGALTLPKADLERIDAAIAKAEGEST